MQQLIEGLAIDLATVLAVSEVREERLASPTHLLCLHRRDLTGVKASCEQVGLLDAVDQLELRAEQVGQVCGGAQRVVRKRAL